MSLNTCRGEALHPRPSELARIFCEMEIGEIRLPTLDDHTSFSYIPNESSPNQSASGSRISLSIAEQTSKSGVFDGALWFTHSASSNPNSTPSVNKMLIDFLLNGPTLPRILRKNSLPYIMNPILSSFAEIIATLPCTDDMSLDNYPAGKLQLNNFGHDSKLT